MSTQHTAKPRVIVAQRTDPADGKLKFYFADYMLVNQRVPNYEAGQANARLYTAARELLVALQVLVDHASETYPHFESLRGQADIRTARAAIAKATKE